MQQRSQAHASDSPAIEQTELPLREAAASVFSGLRRQFAELLELFTLEVRYSGLMLGSVVGLALVVALAIFSLWGLFLAAAGVWLSAAGWGWAGILSILALANAVLVLAALWLMRHSLKRIGIRHTRQALGLGTQNVSE